MDSWESIGRAAAVALGGSVEIVGPSRRGESRTTLDAVADGVVVVLKVLPAGPDVLANQLQLARLVRLLRRRGHPSPEYLGVGTADGLVVTVQRAMPGVVLDAGPAEPVDPGLLDAVVPAVLDAIELQGDVAPAGAAPWPGWLLDTIHTGGAGYCLHETMRRRAVTSAILDRVTRIGTRTPAEGARTSDVVHFDLNPANILHRDSQLTERLASDSDPIAPTEDDYRYLRYERAYIGECEAERDAQVRVIGALLEAVAHPSTPSTVEVFGAAVTIVVEPEDDDESEMLSMAFDFTTFEERDRFPIDILGFVPGYESVDAWDILPPLRSGDPECWFTYVSARWVEWLSTAVELDELLGAGGVASTPTSSVDGRLAHLAPASVVTLAYVEGIEITALCGARFAPCRNPENFETCPACAEALALLRTGPGERPTR